MFKAYNRDRSYAIDQRCDAEAGLVVQLYMEGNSLTKIAALMGRPIEQVSRTFHSDQGRIEYAKYKSHRQEVRDEIRTRAVYAAQGALDEIISISRNAESPNTRRLASRDILELAEVGPQTQVKGGTIVNIGDDALTAMCNVIRELHSPLPEAAVAADVTAPEALVPEVVADHG